MVDNFILSLKVFHKRNYPRVNSFRYSLYYVALDMINIKTNSKFFGINKFNLWSFYDKDHGLRDGSSCLDWAKNLLQECALEYDHIKLLTMPRVLGYLFNPVSFWLCYHQEKLIAVIAEVNNTFGETHSYICHRDGAEITQQFWFEADKVFHVSPFYQRQGYYKFNFNFDFKINAKNQVIINYYDNDRLELGTSINGFNKILSTRNLLREFFRTPLLTLKVTFLIHYQALKILFKKAKYVSKPVQHKSKTTVAKCVKYI